MTTVEVCLALRAVRPRPGETPSQTLGEIDRRSRINGCGSTGTPIVGNNAQARMDSRSNEGEREHEGTTGHAKEGRDGIIKKHDGHL